MASPPPLELLCNLLVGLFMFLNTSTSALGPLLAPAPAPAPAGVCPLEVRLPEAGVGLPQQPQRGHHALRGPDCHTAGQEIG